jgi:hypothetical protein
MPNLHPKLNVAGPAQNHPQHHLVLISNPFQQHLLIDE